jgi:hypothetical protein
MRNRLLLFTAAYAAFFGFAMVVAMKGIRGGNGSTMMLINMSIALPLWVLVRNENLSAFWDRFRFAWAGWFGANVVFYAFLIWERKIITVLFPFGHLWRLAFLAACAAAIAAPIAVLSQRRSAALSVA